MQLFVGKEMKQEVLFVVDDHVEELLVSCHTQLFEWWQIYLTVATSLAAEEDNVNLISIGHLD